MIPFALKKFISKLRHRTPTGAGYISWHARIEGKGAINVGAHSFIARDAWLHSRTPKCNITIGEYSSVESYARLVTQDGGHIKIGDHTKVDSFCVIYGHPGSVEIGSYVRMATHIVIVPANHKFAGTGMIYGQGDTSEGVVIEDDVWIGSGVIILDGVRIGAHSVIGAGSVVTKSVPPQSVVVGVPAKVIKTRTDSETPSEEGMK